MHKFLSVFVLIVMAFHALIMLPDPYADFEIRELLIPFQSHYRNNAMAAGIVTLYGCAFVTATFYMKGVISQKLWRLIHYATFALFLSALAHGVWSGSDSDRLAVQYSYLAAGAAVLFLTFFRILAARSMPRPVRARAEPVLFSARQKAS
jgi:predicted ferric reductase